MNNIILPLLLLTGFHQAARASENCEISKTPSQIERVLKSKEAVMLAKRTYDAGNIAQIQGIRVDQIKKMLDQVLQRPNADILEALPNFDENKIYRYDFTSNVKLPANFYTVIFAFTKNVEVGIILEGATSNLIAEMRDGDIRICRSGYGN